MRSIGMKLFIVWCGVLFFLACMSFSGFDAAGAQEVLTFGRITDNPKKQFPKMRALTGYLLPRLESVGVKDIRVIFCSDAKEAAGMLLRKEIDVIPETVFAASIFIKQAGAEILVREWRDGVPEYHSVVFTKKDSTIKELSDLKGKVIAFEDPGSSSGFFLPHRALTTAGLKTADIGLPDGETSLPPGIDVGYVFARTEANIPVWVDEGRVDAGAFGNTDWSDDEIVFPEIRKRLRILHKTQSYPRALMLVRNGLDPTVKKRLKKVLLAAHETAEGCRVLEKYKDVSRFDEIPVDQAREMRRAALDD